MQIWKFLWSLFSPIWIECGKIRTRKNSVFGYFLRSVKLNLLLKKDLRQEEIGLGKKKIRILILPEFVKNSLNETGFLGIRLVFYCSYQK